MNRRTHAYALTLTLTPPGGDPITVNVNDATDAGQLTAIAELGITWGMPSGRDHQDPGTITATFLLDIPDAIPWESRLDAHLAVDGRPPMLIAQGWAQVIVETRIDRPAGPVYRYSVSCTDILGRGQAARLAATPWPAEDPVTRLGRIVQASPIALDGNPAPYLWAGHRQPSLNVAARDVDNASALEVLRATTFPDLIPEVLIEAVNGIAYAPPPGTLILRDAIGAWDVWRLGGQPTIPASAVELTTRTTSRATVVDQVVLSVARQWVDAEGVTQTAGLDVTVRPTTARGTSTGSHTITADTAIVTAAQDTPVSASDIKDWAAVRWARNLLELNASPCPVLAPARLDVAQLDASQIRQFTAIATRPFIRVTIDGVTEASVSPYQRVIGGTITYRAGQLAITAQLEPTRVTGSRPMRWSDWPHAGDYTWDAPRFADLATSTVTAAELVDTIAPNLRP